MVLNETFEVKVLKRINRFVVEVEKEGKVLRAHITNTGRLGELLVFGRKGFCVPTVGGKTDCRLSAVEEKGKTFALIDTQLQMRAFEEAFKRGFLSWLKPDRFSLVKRNYRVGNSLIDYLFGSKEGKRLLLEVKSAAMRSEDNFGMYPDCPTERGRKHIRELLKKPSEGGILFICALKGVKGFKPYREGDPEIYNLLREAKKKGLLLKAIGIAFEKPNRVVLEEGDLPVVI